jgi:hypothetical protein
VTEPSPPPQEVIGVPSAPKKLVVKFHGHQVDLSWKDTSDDEQGFRVQRKNAGGDWQQIADLPAGTHKFVDTHLTRGARYSYRVVAYNDGGTSDASNTAKVAIPPRAKKKKPKDDNDDQGENEQKKASKALKLVAKANKSKEKHK